MDISNLDENNDVLNQADRRRMFALGNQLWHTDSSFKRTPAAYSLLHAHSVTPEGGETQFVDMRVAWETLPQKLQARIESVGRTFHLLFPRQAGIYGVYRCGARRDAACAPSRRAHASRGRAGRHCIWHRMPRTLLAGRCRMDGC